MPPVLPARQLASLLLTHARPTTSSWSSVTNAAFLVEFTRSCSTPDFDSTMESVLLCQEVGKSGVEQLLIFVAHPRSKTAVTAWRKTRQKNGASDRKGKVESVSKLTTANETGASFWDRKIYGYYEGVPITPFDPFRVRGSYMTAGEGNEGHSLPLLISEFPAAPKTGGRKHVTQSETFSWTEKFAATLEPQRTAGETFINQRTVVYCRWMSHSFTTKKDRRPGRSQQCLSPFPPFAHIVVKLVDLQKHQPPAGPDFSFSPPSLLFSSLKVPNSRNCTKENTIKKVMLHTRRACGFVSKLDLQTRRGQVPGTGVDLSLGNGGGGSKNRNEFVYIRTSARARRHLNAAKRNVLLLDSR
ncbi:hypothetical protein BDK51DRAFT_32629 [Blyttiomyces helicus]|uniref:Uncharacterized protein n=1 Tax=Blyttiomyces helicus TaxID=388810 RepID=A0A4P9VZD8_9FUNG|nr:hypothetical protein BDK51DRAFT_32629 [Blyttiomyces helicus]|eukprot:RKO84682.1 hypothetical protein BDK51DRAFT_32629 [Blyttiomyces helicus]